MSSPSSFNSSGIISPTTPIGHDFPRQILRLTNGYLCENGSLTQGDLWVDCDTGIIIDRSAVEPAEDLIQTFDVEGSVISPGFLDIQLNGAFGFDFSTPLADPKQYTEGLTHMQSDLVKTGVTGYCPTLPSTYMDVYHAVLPLLVPTRTYNGAENLGLHLEGPFLSPKKPGCHPQDALRTAPDHAESFFKMYGQNNIENTRIITLAPELDGVMDAIPDLVASGVVVSLGHSTANYSTGCQALEKGATMVTHMYNAMRQPHHREPGLFGLLGGAKNISDLTGSHTSPAPWYGIIADGLHVHPAALAVAYRSNPETCCLVTDAMAPMGLPSGTYHWSGQTIIKDDLKLLLEGTNTLAGSAIELDASVRNLMKWLDIPLPEALKTVTSNPAKAVGVWGRKGTLCCGADADLVLLDHQGYISKVFKLGRCVYNANGNNSISKPAGN